LVKKTVDYLHPSKSALFEVLTPAEPIQIEGDPFGSSVTFTAAVPEPSEYALLLAGLGLMGWTARRRRAKTSS
jgi:hypothetical protein